MIAKSPRVSVVMPALNAERYIKSAIDSILAQTYTDFELIIINDGSTDRTQAIIDSYDDKRIRALVQKNQGLVPSLTTGFEMAEGVYIARMDSDDLSTPDRLQKQVDYLETHSKTALVGSSYELIDEEDRGQGVFWAMDRPVDVRREAYVRNPICHGSVMMRRSAWIKSGGYDSTVGPVEDYDVWWRIMQSHEAANIPDVLYLWRVNEQGITYTKIAVQLASVTALQKRIWRDHRNLVPTPIVLRDALQHYNQLDEKHDGEFARHYLDDHYALSLKLMARGRLVAGNKLMIRLWKLDSRSFFGKARFIYELLVVDRSYAGLAMYTIWPQNKVALPKVMRIVGLAKKALRHITSFGRKSAGSRKLTSIQSGQLDELIQAFPPIDKNKRQVLLLLPHAVVGGADQVALDIVRGLDTSKVQVHLATESNDNPWLERFKDSVTTSLELASVAAADQYVTVLQQYIKALSIQTILTSNNATGYYLSQALSTHATGVQVIDLLHGQSGKESRGGMPRFSERYDNYLSRRVVINDYLKQYMCEKYHVDPDRITTIYNGIDPSEYDPSAKYQKDFRSDLNVSRSNILVSWIGRLAYEKHPEHLISLAEELVHRRGIKHLKFVIVGDGEMRSMLQALIKEKKLTQYIYFVGLVDDSREILAASDMLVMTSEMEGSPLVILEAMAMQVPVIAPSVGGIPEQIDNGKTGYTVGYNALLSQSMADKIELLVHNADLRETMGQAARRRVQKQFSLTSMQHTYSKLLQRDIHI